MYMYVGIQARVVRTAVAVAYCRALCRVVVETEGLLREWIVSAEQQARN